MDEIIVDVKFEVRNKRTGEPYEAHMVVEHPAGHYGMIWAWIMIDTEFGVFYDAYKPTQLEAMNRLREQMTDWEKV